MTTLKSSHRYWVSGRQGTGKTYLAINLLFDNFDTCVLFDWKRDRNTIGKYVKSHAIPVVNDIDGVRKCLEEGKKCVYRPSVPPQDCFNELCETAFNYRNSHLMIDEVKGVYSRVGGSGLEPWHDRLMIMGRDRRVGVTNISQRPKRVPLECISEADHLFCFAQNLEEDRDRLKKVCGPEMERLGSIPKRHFLYSDLVDVYPCKPI